MIATLPSSLIVDLPIAVAAGFVSFISPCVLPLLPGYLAFLSGAAGSLEGRSGRGRAVVGAVAFIIGFAIVFVSLGALFGGFGALLRDDQRTLSIVFGTVTIALGMFFAGWWPSSFLNRERRIHHLPRASILGAGALGFLFALGWTPCLGPTLGAIQGLAASNGATRIDPRVLLLPRTGHPLHRRGVGDRMGVDRVVMVTTTSASDRSYRWRAADRHRRTRDHGVVAHVRPVARSALPLVTSNLVVIDAS
jgi:cytochrome c biogenesis protein CcdA